MVVLFVFTASFLRFQREFKIKSIIAAAVLMCFIVFVMNAVLLNRLENVGVHFLTVAQSSGYTETIPLTNDFLSFLMQAEESYAKFLFLITHYCQYYLHGYFEAILIINEYQGNHQFGKYQFFFLYKLIGMLVGQPISADEVVGGISRMGVYDTFFGAAFVDFSYAMILFGALFGFFFLELSGVASNTVILSFFH